MKLKYSNFMMQITRQCNLKCAHCAKGEAEALTLKKEYIDETLKQIGQIDTLSLVGGEPFLEPQIIKYLVEQIKAQKIIVYSFTVVSNGTVLNKDIAEMFNEISLYCKSCQIKDNKIFNKCASIEISTSPYHNNEPQKASCFYKEHCNARVNIKLQGNPEQYGQVFASGRGKAINGSFAIPSLNYMVRLAGNNVLDPIQLNANGTIGTSALVEYSNEDSCCMGAVIGNQISDLITQWNTTHCLDCQEAVMKDTSVQAINSGKLDEYDLMVAKKMLNEISVKEENI